MDSIKKFISSLFGNKSSSVLGIDISSSSIKVVELSKKQGKPVLETYGELALGPYGGTEVGRSTDLPTDKIVEALIDILQEAKVSSRDCGIAIPMSSSLIRLIEMPDLGEEKLKKMIPLEIRKYVPVPISEVLLDWWIIPQEGGYTTAEQSAPKDSSVSTEEGNPEGEMGEKKVDVLVVAIHNEVFTRYRDIARRTDLESSFFEIEIFSTLRAILDRNKKPQMIIDMGAATTKMYVVERGIIRSSHIMNTGSQDLTMKLSSARGVSVAEAEEEKRKTGITQTSDIEASANPSSIFENILNEAKRVKGAFEKKAGKQVDQFIFTGGGSIVQGLESHAKEILGPSVRLADPFARVESPPFLDDVLKEVGPEFTVAIGVALRKLEESQ